jgi:hypothetical protein
MERSIVVQQEPTALRPKWWPHPGNGLQQSSDNLKVESTVDCLSLRHKFFMKHILFVEKCDQHDFDLGLSQMKLFGPW